MPSFCQPPGAETTGDRAGRADGAGADEGDRVDAAHPGEHEIAAGPELTVALPPGAGAIIDDEGGEWVFGENDGFRRGDGLRRRDCFLCGCRRDGARLAQE
jgi:hypothetical protein